jgi:hypothetical protein
MSPRWFFYQSQTFEKHKHEAMRDIFNGETRHEKRKSDKTCIEARYSTGTVEVRETSKLRDLVLQYNVPIRVSSEFPVSMRTL